MNRDVEAATSSCDATTRKRAMERSCGGGVKLVELAGGIFCNKDDKKGQHDVWHFYAEAHLSKLLTFPDTSNTQFGFNCEGSAELIVHLDLYIEFMDFVCDKKEKQAFNHMELNVYHNLHDMPTLAELAVLAMYGQAISHPYIQQVCCGGLTNYLDLGPLHISVKVHIHNISTHPDLLLSSEVTAKDGALDGEEWECPEVFPAIQKLIPRLPDLRGPLVAFFEGALEMWGRFMEEFDSASPIIQLSAEQHQHTWMKPTNDDNEGALGAYQVAA